MSATAKLFMHGRSQAVRLPKEFRFEGTEVRVSKVGNKVVLEPLAQQAGYCRRLGKDRCACETAKICSPKRHPDDPPAEARPAHILRLNVLPRHQHRDFGHQFAAGVLRARLDAELASGVTIGIPAIALFEMRYGAAKSDRRARSDGWPRSLPVAGRHAWPFEPEDAAHAGNIRAELEQAGTPIGHYDYLIAAQARRRGATLVTANFREFARVPGLLVVDWMA